METVHLELPQFYSSAHREIATSLLAAIDQTNRPYSSDWTAPWLLTSIKSPDWIVGDDDSWLGDDGVWHEASVYHWAYRLPDGTCLTDDANERMLIAAQRVAFLWRTLPDGLCTTSSVLLGCLYGLSVFIRWLYLHAPVFAPAEHVFQRVDHASLCDFATRFVTGGVPWVLDYPQQVLVRWFDRSLGMKPPRSILNNPFSVSPEYKKAIAGWLMGVGYYRPAVRDGEMYIDRRRLADEMHFELNSIKSHARFSAFLRQFEPTVKSSLLKGRETRREFPSHRTPLLSEASRMGTQAESNYSRMLTGLFQLRTHLPSIIPDTTNFRFGEISRIFQRGNAPTHTPWIPLNIALKLTQEALRWVFVYGSDLVEAYLDTCQKLILQGYFHTGNLWRAGIPRRERFVRGLVFSNSLVPIRIDGWATKTISSNDAPAFAEFRRAPGLNDALAVLVGAVIVLLSFLKPIRVCEIRDLARDCVMYAEGDGYWLSQRAAKKLLAGKRPTDERPIPRIVCVALSLMDRLGEGLRKMTGDCPEALRGRLFYLPDRDVSDALYVGPLTPARERSYLDRFCDWGQLAVRQVWTALVCSHSRVQEELSYHVLLVLSLR
ncbi:hypothetical protein [Paraburkholderia sp. 32]|uniref:hypothetical protein n=1 Tax=Paraburkholderia sp. 32 TaxID=2991057 RepID=UPI003D2225A3